MTTSTKTKMFQILQKTIFEYCVDNDHINDIRQIISNNGKSFSDSIKNNDIIRIKSLASNELTMAGYVTKEVNKLNFTTCRRTNVEVKYIGEDAEEKLQHVVNVLRNSLRVNQCLKKYGFFIERISSVQNISAVFNDTYYEQAVIEVLVIHNVVDVVNCD